MHSPRITLVQVDLNLLLVLDALLERGSVQGAAEELHLTPPAVSHALRRLRAATQDDVLVRNGRTMVPTPRALQLREEVRELVRRSRLVLEPPATLDLATLDRTFTIRGNDDLLAALAPALLEGLAASAPRVAVAFLSEYSTDGQELVRGLADIEIGGAGAHPPAIRTRSAGQDHLVAVLRSGHPLADRSPFTVADLAAAPQVAISRRGRFRGPIDDALLAAGLRRRVLVAVPSTSTALEVVRGTDLLAVAPERLVAGAAGVVLRRMPLSLPSLPAVVGWHRRNDTDPAHAWLRERVWQVLSQLLSDDDGRSA